MCGKTFHVCILASRTTVLYVGVTSDLVKRVGQHRSRHIQGFTARYNVDQLVHFEDTSDAIAAITREKQIQGWTRAKKVALIEVDNPGWNDLSEGWFGSPRRDPSLRSG